MNESTLKVPVELAPMFEAEAEATVRYAAQAHDEATRLRPEEIDGAKKGLSAALELADQDHKAGVVSGGTGALASTARGVLLTLADQLEEAANRAPLPEAELGELARLVEAWAPEVARLEGEVS